MSKVLYIIARSAGWDGCAMQSEHWLDILVKNKFDVTLLTGEFEESTKDFSPYDKTTIIEEPLISLKAQSALYENGFENSYKRPAWMKQFLRSKSVIREKIEPLYRKHDMIILHNISLRYLVPALWAALYELSIEYPDKRIISIEPDSPYERRYLLNTYSIEVLYTLYHPSLWYGKERHSIYATLNRIRNIGVRMLPGPVHLENVHHVVLNTYQYNVHRDIFGIPETHLDKIPDMDEFLDKAETAPDEEFFEYLRSHQITNKKQEVIPESLFFISPVRPVYRKNIRYLIKAMVQFAMYLEENKNLKPDIFLVITHMNKDDSDYFNSLTELAEELGITIIYLGDSLRIRRLDKNTDYIYSEVLDMFSGLKSIVFSGSAFGGWENAIVEATAHSMPVLLNPKNPAFSDMIRMGFIYHLIPFITMPKDEELKDMKIWKDNDSFALFLEDIYSFFYDSAIRERVTAHNYKTGRDKQSLQYLSEKYIVPLLKGR